VKYRPLVYYGHSHCLFWPILLLCEPKGIYLYVSLTPSMTDFPVFLGSHLLVFPVVSCPYWSYLRYFLHFQPKSIHRQLWKSYHSCYFSLRFGPFPKWLAGLSWYIWWMFSHFSHIYTRQPVFMALKLKKKSHFNDSSFCTRIMDSMIGHGTVSLRSALGALYPPSCSL
jgi:hypothetical protein